MNEAPGAAHRPWGFEFSGGTTSPLGSTQVRVAASCPFPPVTRGGVWRAFELKGSSEASHLSDGFRGSVQVPQKRPPRYRRTGRPSRHLFAHEDRSLLETTASVTRGKDVDSGVRDQGDSSPLRPLFPVRATVEGCALCESRAGCRAGSAGRFGEGRQTSRGRHDPAEVLLSRPTPCRTSGRALRPPFPPLRPAESGAPAPARPT